MSQFPKRSKGGFWKMTPDKLDVHPPKTTVLKRIGDGGLSAWGGGSLTARWGLPLACPLPSL